MEDERIIPQELDDILAESKAAKNLRDLYVRLPFCHRRALLSSERHVKKEYEFWRKVADLYPEVGVGQWSYQASKRVVFRN